MPLASVDGKTIFFAHVPKTGGSSVEDYLFRRFGRLSIIDRNKREGVNGTGLIVPSTHLATEDLVELLPHDLTYSFTVVREPMARLMSEYRYQTGVSRSSRLSFSTWLHIMIAAAQIEPRIYENHIRPQCDLVPDDCQVFRLEDGFDDMIAKLDQIVGASDPALQVGHLLKRKHNKIIPSRQDVDLVTAFYRKDYTRFGYQPYGKDGLPDDKRRLLRAALAKIIAPIIVRRHRLKWVLP